MIDFLRNTLASATRTLVGWLIPLLIILIFVIVIAAGLAWIRRSIQSAARLLPKLSDLSQLRNALGGSGPDLQRSLQSMEQLVLPEIAADFPELNVEAMRAKVTQELSAFFAAEGEAKRSTDHARRLYSEWWTSFQALHARMGRADGQSVYKVVIKNYSKTANQRHIVWQAGFYYSDGQSSGLTDRVDVIYTYDLKEQSSEGQIVTVGMHCPSCGAPVEHVGAKTCRYCQSPLNANWDMVWKLSSVQRA